MLAPCYWGSPDISDTSINLRMYLRNTSILSDGTVLEQMPSAGKGCPLRLAHSRLVSLILPLGSQLKRKYKRKPLLLHCTRCAGAKQRLASLTIAPSAVLAKNSKLNGKSPLTCIKLGWSCLYPWHYSCWHYFWRLLEACRGTFQAWNAHFGLLNEELQTCCRQPCGILEALSSAVQVRISADELLESHAPMLIALVPGTMNACPGFYRVQCSSALFATNSDTFVRPF